MGGILLSETRRETHKHKAKLHHVVLEILLNVSRGTWVAESVKHLTLDCGSGHDLTVCEFEPPRWAVC